MIVWVDIETTGLDPRIGHVLEFAAVVTDDDLDVLYAVEGRTPPATYLRAACDDFVLQMHTASGLWDAIEARDTMSPADAMGRLYDELACEYGSDTLKATPLGGSSVHFDRNFLEHWYYPAFLGVLSHRHFDVSALNEFAKRFAPEAYESRPQAEPRHRAMPDVRFSIELAKHYRRRFGRTPL